MTDKQALKELCKTCMYEKCPMKKKRCEYYIDCKNNQFLMEELKEKLSHKYEYTFKEFKVEVIRIMQNYSMLKLSVLKQVLKFHNDKAYDYYKCGSYQCWFPFKGEEYTLYYGFPPCIVVIYKSKDGFPYREQHLDDLEQCIKDFFERNIEV